MKAGIKEIIEKSVKNMIEFGEDEEKIMKYLEINRQELEKIKEKLVKSQNCKKTLEIIAKT